MTELSPENREALAALQQQLVEAGWVDARVTGTPIEGDRVRVEIAGECPRALLPVVKHALREAGVSPEIVTNSTPGRKAKSRRR